ncbi:MAG: hypothetical protein OET63_10455 [Desulfobacterales bacterium]|jgi:hypothetical protein|nr:hypothetical protein [Desulfobacterales bacterium]
MKNIAANLKAYAHFYLGLRGFLRQKVSVAEAEAIVRQNIEQRDTNFMRLMERGIFGYRNSPYLPLLKLAGCELGDIRNRVETRGLEATLRELRDAGVYVTFEEFKGRKPIVRNGKVFQVEPRQFDNPYLSRHYYSTTGGTTGSGIRVRIDLDHLAADAPHMGLVYHIHGVLNTPMAIWFGTLPDPTGTIATLMRSRCGSVPLKWFSPVVMQDSKPPLKYRLTTQFTVIAGRMSGVPIPRPQPVSLDQAAIIARWLAKTASVHGASLLVTHVSQAMRVCIAAMEEELDLTHVTIMAGGEPPSPAKIRIINRSGARWVPLYFFTEAGAVGLGCAHPVDETDVHFLKDSLALIQYPRQVPGSETTVEAFNYTSLLPAAPKLLLNVESDDYGILETRSCGCPFETCGYTEHLREIRSFRKLTGEGVTLIGSDMLHILEEELPARFGGSPLDYQLLEEEDQQGFTRLSLLVHPRIQITDESQVIATVLDALRRRGAGPQAIGLWKQAETLRIKRQEPILTGRGKFMPLHRIKSS